MPRSFLIDTDTASDDAVALIMALRSAEIQVEAITTVAGNVAVEQATRNALYTVELCGAEVRVHSGADRPLLRAHHDAASVHGRDGLSDRGYPAPRRKPEAGHAVDAICEAVEAHPGIELVTLGPLTNIALALAREPRLAANVARCVVMGGAAASLGNVTPAAEYNIWADPEAARMVLHSDLPVELVGWHLCVGPALLDASEIDRIAALRSPLAQFAVECNGSARKARRERTGQNALALPDPIAMSIALDPSIGLCWGEHRVEVETSSELTRGMTVVDRLDVAGEPQNRNAWAALLGWPKRTRVCWSIDVARWKEALFRALST